MRLSFKKSTNINFELCGIEICSSPKWFRKKLGWYLPVYDEWVQRVSLYLYSKLYFFLPLSTTKKMTHGGMTEAVANNGWSILYSHFLLLNLIYFAAELHYPDTGKSTEFASSGALPTFFFNNPHVTVNRFTYLSTLYLTTCLSVQQIEGY